MEHPLTPSTEDYLKYIYDLTRNGESASTNALAARLEIKPASVTGMLQRLAAENPALVEYLKHQGVTLTPAGEHAALDVIRRHRLLETWLVKTLGYSWDEVHKEACRLEHVISEEFEKRVAAALGNPTRDPHGDPIPASDLSMPVEHSLPLASLRKGQSGVIRRVNGQHPAFLRHLQDLGLVPGAQVTVQSYSEFDSNLTLEIDGRAACVVGPAITQQVFVETR